MIIGGKQKGLVPQDPMGVSKFKLEENEILRIKKIGNFYFAYARGSGSDLWIYRKERYLGRCDPDGSPTRSKKLRSQKLRSKKV